MRQTQDVPSSAAGREARGASHFLISALQLMCGETRATPLLSLGNTVNSNIILCSSRDKAWDMLYREGPEVIGLSVQ